MSDIPLISCRRYITSMINGTSAVQSEGEDYIKAVTRIETISGGKISPDKVGYVHDSEDIERYKLLPGDLLFSHINSMSMIGNCAFYNDDFPLYLGMNLLRLRPQKNVFPKFLFYCFRSAFVQNQVRSYAKPAINQASISIANLKRLLLPQLDFQSQEKIANFLDNETARIDALIEKNERLINLCEEKARAVIDSVFSKAKSLIAIKHVANINYDTLSSNSPDDMEIRYADLSRVFPRGGIDPEVMAFKDAPSRARRIVHENDVLFASVGPFSKKVLSAREEDEGAVVSTGFFVMKAKRGHHSRFLEKILQSTHVLSAVEKGAVGAIYAAINDSTFRNIRIPAFSYEEQVKFSEDMEAQISNLSALSEKAGRMNVLLKEKRSALITAAVTGQIDIPEE